MKVKEGTKKKIRNFITGLLFDIAGSICYSVGIYVFAKHADFAPGGISGLSLIINYMWGLPIGLTSLVFNIPLIIFSYRIVGRKFLLRTARSMLLCTFFIDYVFPYFPVYKGSPLLAALYYGVSVGAGLTLFYMNGSSSGGTDFLTMSIKTLKPHLSIGKVMMMIDLFIIALGWPVFGNVDAVLYGLVATFVASIVVDKIMYGVGAGTLAIIITEKGGLVAEKIDAITGRGSTTIRAIGSYSKDDKDVLLCACSNSQAYRLRKTVYEVDARAFVMLTETSEVYGEGFRTMNPS